MGVFENHAPEICVWKSGITPVPPPPPAINIIHTQITPTKCLCTFQSGYICDLWGETVEDVVMSQHEISELREILDVVGNILYEQVL